MLPNQPVSSRYDRCCQYALQSKQDTNGMLSRNQGDLDKACHHLELSLALTDALSDPSARVAALNNQALTRGATGDIELR